jgi:hypothetical protein
MHVAHTIANNSIAPYLNWFAEGLSKYPDVDLRLLHISRKSRMIEK